MARTTDILLKGTRGGLLIRFDEGDDFETVKARLAEKLDSAQKFFHGSEVTIDVGGRVLTTGELLELEALCRERYGVRVLQVVNGSAEEEEETRAREDRGRGRSLDRVAGSRDRSPSGARDSTPPAESRRGRPVEEPARPDSILIRRTLRSGQRVRFQGNVVILGDVNPGAEVVATGDIIVMGALRGMAHAGAGGEEGAVVAAFRLHPTQLRIGPHISRAPDDDAGQGAPDAPEIARVRNGQVVIDLYEPFQAT